MLGGAARAQCGFSHDPRGMAGTSASGHALTRGDPDAAQSVVFGRPRGSVGADREEGV